MSAIGLEFDLDPASEAAVSRIRESAGMWSSLLGKKSPAKDEGYVAQSEMSPEELKAMMKGLEPEAPIKDDISVEADKADQVYYGHMVTMAIDKGINPDGMNMDELTDAVDNPQSTVLIGANAISNFLGGDVKAGANMAQAGEVDMLDLNVGDATGPNGTIQLASNEKGAAQEFSLSAIFEAGSPSTPNAKDTGQAVQIG